MRVAYARDTASRMNFGKITLGALLLAIGVLLLAVRAGFAHPDTPLLLLRFWPLLLIAFGLAFLASVIKNPFMGCLAVLLILGGTALGMFWMNRQAKLGHVPRSTFSLDLRKTNAASLTVRVQTDVGRFYIGQGTPPTKTLLVRVRKIAGDSTTGYRFAVTRKEAVFEWPEVTGMLRVPPLGNSLDLRVPNAVPLALHWRGHFASMNADLTTLRPTRCDLHGFASSMEIGFGDRERPREIRVGGLLSIARIQIPGDCPVRLVSRPGLVWVALPFDFEKEARERGKDEVHVAKGRGRPVTIVVDGPLVRVTIDRKPITTNLVKEEREWPEMEGTASRFHSPWS